MKVELPLLSAQYITIFGKAKAKRCQFISHDGGQCGSPSLKGQTLCYTHSGGDCGPRTTAGLKKCSSVKRVHGRETRALRKARSEKLRELHDLEILGRQQNLFDGGKLKGRPPSPRRK